MLLTLHLRLSNIFYHFYCTSNSHLSLLHHQIINHKFLSPRLTFLTDVTDILHEVNSSPALHQTAPHTPATTHHYITSPLYCISDHSILLSQLPHPSVSTPLHCIANSIFICPDAKLLPENNTVYPSINTSSSSILLHHQSVSQHSLPHGILSTILHQPFTSSHPFVTASSSTLSPLHRTVITPLGSLLSVIIGLSPRVLLFHVSSPLPRLFHCYFILSSPPIHFIITSSPFLFISSSFPHHF